YVQSLGEYSAADGVLAAIAATLAWGPLSRKRISRITAECLPWWTRLFGTLIGASVEAERHEAARFCGIPIDDILQKRSLTDAAHGIDLQALAMRYVEEYARYKSKKKTTGSLDIQKIPGVNHPVFKDRPVNYDPREVYVRELFDKRGEYNVFHQYYHALVQAVFEAGVSRNVYCVNIDAVIAALLLKMLWQPYRDGAFSERALETAAFTIFLYPRML